ncbi:energy-coupling factor transporter ATPase [Pygmaiobacter massiliensis]|uniref:energy-coupling factor transporter ATPase n=1 Tax=Pygmaiobacter massiliensis TaxID=1917873 RepID=UPI002A7F69D0|nr:energy-coupling factor transporter ATPase [Pygmaiobacter massiliensis]MDY4785763.1 energy-coupling factor transporter ATPase [Pygmaiobacter massiliensis]
MSVIKTENLKYVYGAGLPGATTAVNGINIEIEKGEFVGVIGPTGCGKSTLITHFNGLLRPTEGKLYIDGVDIWAEPSKIRQFRFKVGLVFQYPEYQLFEETIYKDIAFGPKNMGLPEDEIHARVMRAAKFVGLSQEMMERSPFELSGGQKRRVAIAGVLAMEPEVLVLDEPAAGLDPEGREMILSQVKRYHKETGTTVVLVSHSMEDIAKFADRVLVLQAGEVAMFDRTENIFARADELVELGLSVPEVTKIFLKMKELGAEVPTDVYTVKYARDRILEALAKKGGAPHA